MAQTKSNIGCPNNFNVSGFVAVDARITNFAKSSVARFPLSISAVKKDKDGNETRQSVLINCEVWASAEDQSRLDMLKKGRLLTLGGYFLPEEYDNKNGEHQSRLTFRCTSVAKPVSKKAKGSKAEPVAEAVPAAEPVTENVPF